MSEISQVINSGNFFSVEKKFFGIPHAGSQQVYRSVRRSIRHSRTVTLNSL
jgi:hypothetical protein